MACQTNQPHLHWLCPSIPGQAQHPTGNTSPTEPNFPSLMQKECQRILKTTLELVSGFPWENSTSPSLSPVLCLPKPSQSRRKAYQAGAGGHQLNLGGPRGAAATVSRVLSPLSAAHQAAKPWPRVLALAQLLPPMRNTSIMISPTWGPHTRRYHTRRGLNHFIKPILSLQPVPLPEPSLSIQPREGISPAGPPGQRGRPPAAQGWVQGCAQGTPLSLGLGLPGPCLAPRPLPC